MTKVHPNTSSSAGGSPDIVSVGRLDAAESALTVWRKSLLFNCSGFTVFDSKGNLVFRVDNYGSGSKAELVLMDAAGKPLLTVRRKKLSLGDNWMIYKGEDSVKPLYAVKRHVNLRQSKTLAHVAACDSAAGGGAGGYEIEGSYSQRSCAVYNDRRSAVAEVRRKETACGVALGNDVFRLVVQPDMEASIAMAIVIVVDQMFG